MADCTDDKRKRAQDETGNSGPNSPNSELYRVDSPDPKRLRVDSDESTIDSDDLYFFRVDSDNPHEALCFQDDLLHILDDPDTVTERDPPIQGLDSVIRSFEEEILVAAPAQEVPDLASDSGDSQQELGYLLEASDDELGLPPTVSSGEEAKIEAVDFENNSSDVVGLGGLLGYENEMPSYDSFELGVGVVDSGSNVIEDSGEFVALGGLFDYPDEGYELADNSEFSCWSESLQAL